MRLPFLYKTFVRFVRFVRLCVWPFPFIFFLSLFVCSFVWRPFHSFVCLCACSSYFPSHVLFVCFLLVRSSVRWAVCLFVCFHRGLFVCLFVSSCRYAADWEENRQNEIKKLTAEGTIP
jgi:hypothetical protein